MAFYDVVNSQTSRPEEVRMNFQLLGYRTMQAQCLFSINALVLRKSVILSGNILAF